MYCKQCGKQIGENSKFCEQCGAEVGGDGSVRQTTEGDPAKNKKANAGFVLGIILSIILFINLLNFG